MIILVEIGNQRTELVDRLAPRKPRPSGRGQGELYRNVYLPYREAPPFRAGRLHKTIDLIARKFSEIFTMKSCGGLISLAGYPFWHVFVKLVWTALEDPFFGRPKPSQPR